MAEFDPRAVQKAINKLTKLCDEGTGRAIGIAAVLAALPEASNVDAERVRKVIGRMLKNVAGATSDTRAAANGIAATILTSASVARPRTAI